MMDSYRISAAICIHEYIDEYEELRLFINYFVYKAYTMRLDSIHKTVNGKTYTSHLIREAYRDNGRTRHRTIANLSRCSDDEIEAIRLALKHKGDLANLGSVQ